MKGNLTRRGERSWRLKFDVPSGANGRVTKYVTLKGTKAQAQEQASKIIATAVDGQHIDHSRENVTEFVERWLRDWASSNVSNKTYVRYRELLTLQVAARVGSVPIQKLRAADLQSVYAAMAAEGYAQRTQLHVHRAVNRMLGHAQQWGVVARNVADMVDAPRAQQHEIEVLTPGEVQTMFAKLQDGPLFVIASVLLATGLRRGELLALRWQDLDLEKGTLRVEQSVEETTRGGLVLKPPKTKRSKRTISLPPSTVALLREHRKACQEHWLKLGQGRLADDAWVFANWDGALRSPNAVSKLWRRTMKRLGLKISLHSLRHTHASTLIASGLDVLTISRRLGHSTPTLTLNVYGHLFKSDDHAAAIMEAALTATK